MKRIILGVLVAVLALTLAAMPAVAGNGKGDDGCTTIQDGTLTYSSGHYLEGKPLQIGFDPYGYNYQGHMFVGYYPNVYLGRDKFPPYEGDTEAYLAQNPTAATKWYWYPDVRLIMKWNDAWLSNKDCDGDGALDRHYGFDRYIGSGAWETNHQFGTYLDEDGKKQTWNYFVKIVAAPADAHKSGGMWYTADDTEIGPDIWGQFAIILQIYNDTGEGVHGVEYRSPTSAGFGFYMP